MGFEERVTEAQNEETREGTEPCSGVRPGCRVGEAEEKREAEWGPCQTICRHMHTTVWVPRRGQRGKAWNQVQLGAAEMPEEKGEKGGKVR